MSIRTYLQATASHDAFFNGMAKALDIFNGIRFEPALPHGSQDAPSGLAADRAHLRQDMNAVAGDFAAACNRYSESHRSDGNGR